MKTLFVTSLTVLMLVFTGCSQKSPQVDTTQTTSQDASSADSKMDNISGMDSTNIDSEAATAEKIAKLIADIEANAELFKRADAAGLSIKIEGNCDEWGTDEYNYALGLKRAKSVKDALVAQGVSESRIMVVSFGESNPACSQSNKDCWAQNRRAEFKLLP
jgi:peptidoglycan-associated lipoprotein